MGAMRGIELCIPTGSCEGCGSAVTDPHVVLEMRTGDDARHALHQHADGRRHRHEHGHAKSDLVAVGGRAGDLAQELRRDAPSAEVDCPCHIHVTTPDDDAERRHTSPSTGPLFMAVAVGIDPWILAAALPSGATPPARPPNQDGPPQFEQVLIDTTELLV
jgi:hypothetical protein